MQVILLAGGRGTRLEEETVVRPKPMVEIGGRPMLWHIMMVYAAYGFRDFLIACGYKGEVIKEYFHNFVVHNNDYFISLKDGSVDIVSRNGIDWKVGVIDTGLDTMTGGRVRRLKQWTNGDTFMVTYGDGIGNVNIRELLDFHRSHGLLATVTAVRPPARFGDLTMSDDGDVLRFAEKPQTGEGWINGGFFVFEPGVFDYLADDDTILEREPLERLASEHQLKAFRHDGFWQPMDTLREKRLLESLWTEGRAPWKVW
ncbi:MAG TPA: glucose-1-phosphate cytidylyltransferase [Rhodothermales bacterium]